MNYTIIYNYHQLSNLDYHSLYTIVIHDHPFYTSITPQNFIVLPVVIQAHLLIDGVMKSPAEFWRVAWPAGRSLDVQEGTNP